MDFYKFADLMEGIGFQNGEYVAPSFKLDKDDLSDPVLKDGYTKIAGSYHVVGIWEQDGEVAFWARKDGDDTTLFPFFKEEVSWLAEKKKFQKN